MGIQLFLYSNALKLKLNSLMAFYARGFNISVQ